MSEICKKIKKIIGKDLLMHTKVCVMDGISSPGLWDASKLSCLSEIWKDLRSQVYGQELGKNWNGQILEDARVLAKGGEVLGRLVVCSAFPWNEYNHWDLTGKLEARRQITELAMGYGIFVLDRSRHSALNLNPNLSGKCSFSYILL